ncbi:hypothetical protein [Bacteriovorax sp. Seq25_V]|uniref:hypothetical protein n=1 Tax=Bacteriovorax sp. Seq25_V TaxID=1201288 RepID=UPI00038A0D00|nr:hypothetical protein [Bacteriovorax sp. Seq25_V]EQC44335.1 hypothetical protein M900_A0418 [Bacteriovorax sp. Seq25_V]
MNKIWMFLIAIFANMTFASESDIRRQSIKIDAISKSSIPSFSTSSESTDYEMFAGGFNDLLPYIMPVPDQEDAGSCLYMSLTGTMEWWNNYLNDLTGDQRQDLSERYYMALMKESIGQSRISNWRTDNIERVNEYSKLALNKQYPYTKSYFKYNDDGDRIHTSKDDEKADYGTSYNWISYKKEVDAKFDHELVTLPKFNRDVIYADPNKNQWAVASAPKDIVSQIKHALVTNKAPVNVIYTHHGFWHAVIIVGFNDHAPTKGCPYTTGYAPFMNEKAQKYEEEAATEEDLKKKNSLLSKARMARKKATTVQTLFEEQGGCAEKGVFYVRDSINPDESMPIYDYDLSQTGEESHLNPEVIFREYQWFETTGNHAYQIKAIK